MRTITTAALSVLLGLGLAGCGGNDEAEARDALAASLLENNTEGPFQVSEEEADCVADGMVEEIGVDQLIDYGFLTEDLEASDETMTNVKLEQEDADSAADVFVGCVDVKALFSDQIEQSMGSLQPEVATCIEDKLSEDVLKEFLATVFAGDQAGATQGVTETLGECLTS